MESYDKVLEALNQVDISGSGMEYEDYLLKLQEDVLRTINEDAEYTGNSPDQCTEIYVGWMKRFIKQI